MRTPTVVLDLSNIATVTLSTSVVADWSRVEAVTAAWRRELDSNAVFFAVGDRSIWSRLNIHGRRNLTQWLRSGRAELVPWADPVVCEMARDYPDASIVTNDRYRDLRVEFPYLQGCERVFGFTFDELGAAELSPRRFEPISSTEVSAAKEDAGRTPKRLRDAAGQALLQFEWGCDNSNCSLSNMPSIDDLPVNRAGVAHCPACDGVLRQLGQAGLTVELKFVVGALAVERVPINEGAALKIGRGGGQHRVDVRRMMPEDRARLISRDQVEVTNKDGNLFFRDLSSRNGTRVARQDSQLDDVAPSILMRLAKGEHIALPGGLLIERSGKRYARGQYVAPVSPLSAAQTALGSVDS